MEKQNIINEINVLLTKLDNIANNNDNLTISQYIEQSLSMSVFRIYTYIRINNIMPLELLSEIKGRKRNLHIIKYRHVIIYLLRGKGYTYEAIGNEMGGRDYSTIIHNVRKVHNAISEKYRDEEIYQTYLLLKKAI